jgi:NAD+ kinase
VGDHPRPSRLALVVHPTRPVDKPLAVIRRWAAETGLELVQLPAVAGSKREIAPLGELRAGDFVVALGGDGTVLAALHASAALDAPVLGVACGSLGALAAIMGEEIDAALERLEYGDWTPRRLPALKVEPEVGQPVWAFNDFVVVRRSTGQLVASVSIDDELYVRSAGDGVIVSTPLGSSAYSMGAGGPLLSAGADAYLYTPLAMHGGNAPPLVVPAGSTLRVQVYPNFAGFDVEIDGRELAMPARDYRLSFHPDKATLVSFHSHGHGVTRLRERRLIGDSPRVLARDDRAARGES